MYETVVTLQGWVGTEVDERIVGDTVCASFRVGSTPRFQRGGVWTNGETSWFTVNCWRSLGRNVVESVRKGDAVIVQGRVKVDVWEREDQPPSVAWIVDATFVGHDLTRGTSAFLRAVRESPADSEADEAMKELVHGYDPLGPRLDQDGEPAVPTG